MLQLQNANIRRAASALCALLVTFLVSSAHAHLMPAGKGTLNVVASKVYVVLSLPVSAFYDGGHKERISQLELKQSEEALRDRVRRGVILRSSGANASLDQILLSLPTGEGHDGQGDEDLLVMIVASFVRPPDSIALSSNLWAEGRGGLRIKATVSEGTKTLKSEVAELSNGRQEHVFFASPGAAMGTSSAAGLFRSFRPVHLLLFFPIVLFLFVKRRLTLRLVGSPLAHKDSSL